MAPDIKKKQRKPAITMTRSDHERLTHCARQMCHEREWPVPR